MSRIAIALWAVFWLTPVRAVENGGSFDTTEPTDAQVSSWTTGWGGSGETGWDYVGQIGGASGVYLGNGWVLTAAHVGAGSFTLDGTTYSVMAGSAHGISSGIPTEPVDLTLFQLTTDPANLPPLILNASDPVPFSAVQAGDSTVMIGYGGGSGKTWGENTVTQNNIPVQVTPGATTYNSIDFETAYGTTTQGASSVTNTTQLVSGDSGGADFILKSGQWELSGINEAIDPSTHDSYMVQVNAYDSQVDAIIDVPEPGTWALLLIGFGFLLGWRMRSEKGPRLIKDSKYLP